MYIDLKKTLAAIERSLPEGREPTPKELRRSYDLVLRLRSQILAVIQDRESFTGAVWREQGSLAKQQSAGENGETAVTLILTEPLPSSKELTASLEEHWVELIHAAIHDAARQGPLPYFKKAFVEIEIVTPKGTHNAKVWDTSNRAINVIINNLKGTFFHDDDMEHMAFSVVGRWGEKGVTILRVSDFDQWRQVGNGEFQQFGRQNHEA